MFGFLKKNKGLDPKDVEVLKKGLLEYLDFIGSKKSYFYLLLEQIQDEHIPLNNENIEYINKYKYELDSSLDTNISELTTYINDLKPDDIADASRVLYKYNNEVSEKTEYLKNIISDYYRSLPQK